MSLMKMDDRTMNVKFNSDSDRYRRGLLQIVSFPSHPAVLPSFCRVIVVLSHHRRQITKSCPSSLSIFNGLISRSPVVISDLYLE